MVVVWWILGVSLAVIVLVLVYLRIRLYKKAIRTAKKYAGYGTAGSVRGKQPSAEELFAALESHKDRLISQSNHLLSRIKATNINKELAWLERLEADINQFWERGLAGDWQGVYATPLYRVPYKVLPLTLAEECSHSLRSALIAWAADVNDWTYSAYNLVDELKESIKKAERNNEIQ